MPVSNAELGCLAAAAGGLSVYLLIYAFVGPRLSRYMLYRRRIAQIADRDIDTLRTRYRSENSLLRKMQNRLGAYAERNSRRARTQRSEKAEKQLAAQLYSAGIALTPSAFHFLRFMLTLLCGIFGMFFSMTAWLQDPMLGMLAVLAAVLAPTIILRFVVSSRITLRQARMEIQLPDVLDLLSISVDAGMGFDQALEYITSSMDGPIVDELTVLVKELGLGRQRKDAFKDMASRCHCRAVTNFSAAVVQAMEMGIPLSNMLRTQAVAARNAHVADVKAKAAKASIKMLIPMVLFIFPVLFIVLMGPAAMNLIGGL
ncbi:type II secretion system F family protein [Lachnoclostridium sp. Marseille-P6806]|uniref:type II secretion system F family protein n=1 Tax=Lachnoclostridium sp. Marseille-P6806 TaxID=2364793 RepID=UPI001031C9E8|nr:type II secretion system F family protein [Lachnoclostridium sp. Marseille-P6806]